MLLMHHYYPLTVCACKSKSADGAFPQTFCVVQEWVCHDGWQKNVVVTKILSKASQEKTKWEVQYYVMC